MLKYAVPKIIGAIDGQSKKISDQISQAQDIKNQAEKILADSKVQYETSLRFCQKLIEDAKLEGEKLLEDSKKSLEEEIKKRTHLSKERIQTAENKAIRELKSSIINSAIQIVEKNSLNVSDNDSSNISAKSIADIEKLIS
ncbi:MAG: F-type H+-transporting ATPase subunit b [Myxococcota bacterium]|jgi:F-type H+-transporting ATPase subunit b